MDDPRMVLHKRVLRFIKENEKEILTLFKQAVGSIDNKYINPLNCCFYTRRKRKAIHHFYRKLRLCLYVHKLHKRRDDLQPLHRFIWIMEHVSYNLAHTYGISMNLGNNRIKLANALIGMVYRHFNARALDFDKTVCSLLSVKNGSKALKSDINFYKRLLTGWKREILQSACIISYKNSTREPIGTPSRQDRKILSTLLYTKLKEKLISTDNKCLPIKIFLKLPSLFGKKSWKEVVGVLTRGCLLILLEFIESIRYFIKQKFILLHPSQDAASLSCTCQTKCTRWYNTRQNNTEEFCSSSRINREVLMYIDNTFVLCSLCRETPSMRNRKLSQCRRTLSPYSYTEACSICGNTSFRNVHMYICKIFESGRFFYRHLAYTNNVISLNKMFDLKNPGSHFRTCSLCDNSRSCFKNSATLDEFPVKCEKCFVGDYSENKTCFELTMRKFSIETFMSNPKLYNSIEEMCSGCKLKILCPCHHYDLIPYKHLQHILLDQFSQ